MIPSFVYMNFIVALNFTAIFLELMRAPRVWIKTERSTKVTGEVIG